MYAKRWTDAEWPGMVVAVAALYQAEKRVGEIEREMKMSGRGVARALKEAGIDTRAIQQARAQETHRKLVAERHAALRDDVLAAYASEESTDVLAARIGVGRSLIATIWKEEGLATLRPWVEVKRGWHGAHDEGQREATAREVEVEVNVLGGVWITLPMVEVKA